MRKEPRQSRSRALVNAIVEAADQVMQRSDEEENELTVRAIAERAGVGIGSVYDYFKDKDALLGLVLAHVTRQNYESLEAKIDQPLKGSFDERLRELSRAATEMYLGSPTKTRTLVRVAVRFRLESTVIRVRDRFAEMLADRLLAEEPHLDREEIVRVAILLCDAAMGVALAEAWREPDAVRREEIANDLAELALSALAPLRARHRTGEG
ncbi:MAG: TetR/AcrR family transcriptional regulator [Myxococcota bacterium]